MDNPWDKFDGLPSSWIASKIDYSVHTVENYRFTKTMPDKIKEYVEWLDTAIDGWRPMDTVKAYSAKTLKKYFPNSIVWHWKSEKVKPKKFGHVQKLYELWEELK